MSAAPTRVPRASTGAAALAAWLARRAAQEGQRLSVEDALLSRQFARYAARRLSGFFLVRAWGTALHLLELTLLVEIFSSRGLVASLAFQNLALLVEAAAWGATEALRRRLRELGPGAPAAELVRRWLTRVTWVALACVLTPLGHGAWLASSRGGAGTPGVLVAYGIAVGVRLAADLLLRTYMSGVFAHGRVYRPLATFFAGPLLLLAVTWTGWGVIGAWSFPLAVLVSTVASRGLAFAYVRRAYRITRTPEPPLHFRLAPPARARARRADVTEGPSARDVALGAVASTTTRIGSVFLLAAAIPSLSSAPEDDALQRLVLALHLAAPLFALASQWGSVFYHDWKRLEDEAAARLARELARRLHVVAVVVAAIAYGALVLVVTRFASWSDAADMLVALAPATLGASVWASLQLRGFAHGAFVEQAAGAAAMILVVGFALGAEVLGDWTWTVAVGLGPWVAVAAHGALGLFPTLRARRGIPTGSLPIFLRLLARARGELVLREARLVGSGGVVASRVARALAADRREGGCVRLGATLLWFERSPGRGLPFWLAHGGGLLAGVREVGCGSGHHLVGCVARGGVDEAAAFSGLRAAHAACFPGGFVLEIGAPPPPAFTALAPAVRQAVWRDALREVAGRKQPRSGFGVVAWAPTGAVRAVFAAPKPVDGAAARRFRAALEAVLVRRVHLP